MREIKLVEEYLAPLSQEGLCVAFSGGVDSAVLLRCAVRVCKRVHAVTVYTPFHSPAEPEEAKELAESIGAAHHILRPELPRELWSNPENRCYICKKALFATIIDYAGEQGAAHVLDGTNADDLSQYRPGLKALEELGVHSPLARLGIPKAQVRRMAEALGLTVAQKPSAPCLATRFPYGDTIDPDKLVLADELEKAVRDMGIPVVRARIHGRLLRLEVGAESFSPLVSRRDEVVRLAKGKGLHYVTLDLEGFRSGSMDEPLLHTGGE